MKILTKNKKKYKDTNEKRKKSLNTNERKR